MTYEEYFVNSHHNPLHYAEVSVAFKAGAASRDAEIAELQRLADEVHAARKVLSEHDRLLVKVASRDAEIAELKKDALDFHGQVNRLTEWNNNLVSHRDELLAETAELVAALEYIAIDDCGCGVPCDCYSWYTLADKAKEALAKVRKP